MTPRWVSISFCIFGLIWLLLGTSTLAEGETAHGIIRLALGFGWLLVAAFKVLRRSPRTNAGPAHDDHVVQLEIRRHPDGYRVELIGE